MNIFVLLTITMVLIIFLLRRHIPIGPCMLAGGLLIWVVKTPELSYLVRAFTETLSLSYLRYSSGALLCNVLGNSIANQWCA